MKRRTKKVVSFMTINCTTLQMSFRVNNTVAELINRVNKTWINLQEVTSHFFSPSVQFRSPEIRKQIRCSLFGPDKDKAVSEDGHFIRNTGPSAHSVANHMAQIHADFIQVSV